MTDEACAWCLALVAQPANAPRLVDPITVHGVTIRDGGAAIEAMRAGCRIVIEGGTRLPMFADTMVRGTFVCWSHVAGALAAL